MRGKGNSSSLNVLVTCYKLISEGCPTLGVQGCEVKGEVTNLVMASPFRQNWKQFGRTPQCSSSMPGILVIKG